MPTLHIVFGPQAAGKSHWRKEKYPEAALVSADATFPQDELGRKRWTDAIGNSGLWSENLPPNVLAAAWRNVWGLYAENLKNGNDFIFEATFPRRKERAPAICIAKAFGYQVIGVYVSAPLHVCLERNARRLDPVPEGVIARTWAAMEFPGAEEGWSQILQVSADTDTSSKT